MFKLDLKKAVEPENKFPTSIGSSKKHESSREMSTSALLIMSKPLTVCITTNCGKFLKRWKFQTTLPLCVCVCVCVLVAQLCPTLCSPIDCSPSGPSVHGILQARTLEWVAISFSTRNYRKKGSEVPQSCLTLCNAMDCSLPGSSIHGIFQARVLEWFAISFSRPPYLPPEKSVCKSRSNR